MVAVIRDYLVLFQLFAISNSIINGHKGLAHAQNCLKSAETVRDVQKCPEKQTEWEEAAQRKKCLEIRKYDNCTDVEYHCLVNEFRNKTIEVCTSPRRLHGYCPHYSSAGTDNTFAVRNDYTKKCVEYSYPCNCSSGYLSTEAYKWQCCYNGTNRGIQINTGLDQNGFLGLWIFLGLVLLVIVYFGFVIYGICCQRKPLCEALCLWRYISCKSLMCACSSSDPRKDEQEGNPMLIGSNTRETIIDERETHNPNSRTSEVNDPKPEPIAPKAANSNSEASEVDGQEPKAIASHLKDNKDQKMDAALLAGGGDTTSEKPVSQTPETSNSNSRTSKEDDPKSEANADEANLNYGESLLLTPDSNGKSISVTATNAPVSQASDNDYRTEATNAPVSQASDNDYRTEGFGHISIAKYNDHLSARKQMMTPIQELPLRVRVKNLGIEKENLKQRLYPAYFGYLDLMEYEIRSTTQKMKAMEKRSSANSDVIVDKLKTKVTELEKSIQDQNRLLDVLGLDLPGNDDQWERSDSRRRHRPKTNVKEIPTKLGKISSLTGNIVEYRYEEENEQIPYDNEQKKEGETSAESEMFIKPRRSDDVWIEPTAAASLNDSQFNNGDEKECGFEKKTFGVQIMTAIEKFEDFREQYYKELPPADLKVLEDNVSEVEDDMKFLLEASRFIDRAERGEENKLGVIKNSLKEFMDNFDRLKKKFSSCELEI